VLFEKVHVSVMLSINGISLHATTRSGRTIHTSSGDADNAKDERQWNYLHDHADVFFLIGVADAQTLVQPV